jgi:membrane associated rhomboid family serine protease
MWPYKIQQDYQLWRFFTSLFLTFGFGQWVTNSFFLLLVGFMLQNSKMSFIKMAVFYLLCGFGGYLFGATCNVG